MLIIYKYQAIPRNKFAVLILISPGFALSRTAWVIILVAKAACIPLVPLPLVVLVPVACRFSVDPPVAVGIGLLLVALSLEIKFKISIN